MTLLSQWRKVDSLVVCDQKELAETPGEVVRDVQLALPPGATPLFKQLPGMESFCEQSEVLRMLKPGYGLKDAPRLWNLALKKVLQKVPDWMNLRQ